MLSLAVVSCGGDKQASPAVSDSAANDSAIHADEAPAPIPPIVPADGNHAKRDAEAVGVEPRKTTPPPVQPKPAPVQNTVDKDAPVPSSDHGVSPTYKSELMNRLQQLDNQANQLMAHVEVVRDRQRVAQQQGVQPNPDDQLDLSNTIDALIDIRNEQIALAKKLGNKTLEDDYISKAANLYNTKRNSLNR